VAADDHTITGDIIGSGGDGMSDVTKGFRDGRFNSLSQRDQQDILKLIARIAEQAYRRGAQQGAGLTQRPYFRANLGEWRYKPSLDLSPWLDRPRITSNLRRIGFPLEDTSSQAFRVQPWRIAGRRSLWTGYTRDQRSAIQAQTGHKAATSRQRHLSSAEVSLGLLLGFRERAGSARGKPASNPR
jgi:hypothetical protein